MSIRLLEDGTVRLLEDLSIRDLEIPGTVPVQAPTLLAYGNPAIQYIQNELEYLRCNVCSRKSYQIEYAGATCNAWNSAPSLFPSQYCPGVLVPSILSTIPQLDFQLVLQERASV